MAPRSASPGLAALLTEELPIDPCRLILLNALAESMVSSGIPGLDEILGGAGYPEKSSILVIGPPGIGKEALGYWFTHSGLLAGDLCIYLTRLSMHDIIEDEKAFGIVTAQRSPVWIAREGGEGRPDLNDLPHLGEQIEGLLMQSQNRKSRVVVDLLSSISMLNRAETVYKFVDGLITSAKQRDAVLLATLEEGMQPVQTQVAMQHLFDGVIELSFHKTGLNIQSLLRIMKMRGKTPHQDYYSFSFTRSGMEIRPTLIGLDVQAVVRTSQMAIQRRVDSTVAQRFGNEARIVFAYLVKSFVEDYLSSRLSFEQAGWRTRIAISEATLLPVGLFYGREGKLGPLLKELLSSGFVEARFFLGQRGRGGEVTKLRVAYEKELVKRIVDNAADKGGAKV